MEDEGLAAIDVEFECYNGHNFVTLRSYSSLEKYAKKGETAAEGLDRIEGYIEAIRAAARLHWKQLGMSGRDRQMVLLAAEGWSMRDVAKHLGVSEWTVHDRVDRARRIAQMHRKGGLAPIGKYLHVGAKKVKKSAKAQRQASTWTDEYRQNRARRRRATRQAMTAATELWFATRQSKT